MDDLDPIIIQVTVPLPLAMIHSAFTDPSHLSGWLCTTAEVDARIGGIYRLSFTDDPPFTSDGVITHLTPELDVGFTWQGPPPFGEIMNLPSPRTSVYVRLQESPEGIDITLEHSGWGPAESEWEDARSWHFHRWDERLHGLREYLLKVAYG
ncbi:MAG: SRPBCC domain-containing protein [Thermoplasmata archaeon]